MPDARYLQLDLLGGGLKVTADRCVHFAFTATLSVLLKSGLARNGEWRICPWTCEKDADSNLKGAARSLICPWTRKPLHIAGN
jgi:hypothetical protein